ncbi:MAG TPA: SpoIIE family protein phosphatase, partial [Candidatus Methylomirabilis sp.]|nr:SpoIIE family protein phosphatase [Candidatus Methylomirabilis sp.]
KQARCTGDVMGTSTPILDEEWAFNPLSTTHSLLFIIPLMASSAAPLPDPILRIHCVRVFVRDQDQSLRFYVDQLGFRLMADTRLQSGERWLAVAPPNSEAVIALVAPAPDSKAYELIGRSTQVVLITDDVVARYKEWSQRGVKFLSVPKLRRVRSADGNLVMPDGKSPIWGGVFASFKDIDGNAFSLVSFDEVTHTIEAQRRSLAEKAEAERRVAQELEIATRVQARLVGGDYYDFLALGRERLSLVIGDIAGKGIAAALLMANLQANLRSQFPMLIEDPVRLLCSVNRLFCENTPDGAYATFLYAEYNDQSRRLRYANCGHLCGLLARADGQVERLHSTATVLGLFRDWDCSVGETGLFPGDILTLYTDGVTEAVNVYGEEFGEERLVDCLQRHAGLPSQALVTTVIDEVRGHSSHEQQDDITVVVAKCKARDAENQLGLPYDWSV